MDPYRAEPDVKDRMELLREVAQLRDLRDRDGRSINELTGQVDSLREQLRGAVATLAKIAEYGDRDADWLKRNAYIVLAEAIMEARSALNRPGGR